MQSLNRNGSSDLSILHKDEGRTEHLQFNTVERFVVIFIELNQWQQLQVQDDLRSIFMKKTRNIEYQ